MDFYGAAVRRDAVEREPQRIDALAMNLLDKSPGGFMVVANAVLYSVVLAETWMLTTSSIVAMGAVMAVIIAVSGGLVRWMGRLMGSEEYALGEPAKATAAPAPAPARNALLGSVTAGHAAHA